MARTKSHGSEDSSATPGFEAKLWLTADTATRVSANPECAATLRDFRGAQDHRLNNTDELETQLAASRATAANLLSSLVAELTTA